MGNKVVTFTDEQLEDYQENPFKERICKVFSHDGSGNMTFDDFLDMLSVFSEPSPRDVKVFYAFRIYDYDEDQMLGPGDIEKATIALTRSELTPEEVQIVVEKVLEEADMDDDGKISFTEFEHVITRAPDFISAWLPSGHVLCRLCKGRSGGRFPVECGKFEDVEVTSQAFKRLDLEQLCVSCINGGCDFVGSLAKLPSLVLECVNYEVECDKCGVHQVSSRVKKTSSGELKEVFPGASSSVGIVPRVITPGPYLNASKPDVFVTFCRFDNIYEKNKEL
ncbi:hypothetical protein HPB52_014917 [Rhipicephalus sanguineus]|uniref:EF-hand domain-containing protein n=1 Tax=Rhipicephalus sanguineus TaxID=34632 RepID=A0A9D4Q1G0_RHISA|nr:hypothetical protein HPB52_014917 [Rhipicephalus sanguineus]